jgi:integrase
MSRKATWPPRIQFHAPSGQDRIRVRGKDYYLGAHGSPEARKEYARLCLQLAGAAPATSPASNPPTVALVALKWREHALKKYGETSPQVKDYDRALAVALEMFRDLPAGEIDVDRLDAVRERMTSSGGRNWCRNFANRMTTRIKTVWRWAERTKMVPKGTWEHLRTLEAIPPLAPGVRETAPRKPCALEDVEKVSAELRPTPQAVLWLCWRTGARPGEFRQLRAGEVDRSGELWVCRPARHKNAHRNQTRAIVLSPEARAIIEPWLTGKGPEDLVFPVPGRGTAYPRQSLCRVIRQAAKRAEVKLYLYQCRHAAKRRVTREMGLDAARAMLGQKSIATTDNYAAGADEDLAREAAKRCG